VVERYFSLVPFNLDQVHDFIGCDNRPIECGAPTRAFGGTHRPARATGD
jgi:hypothetical protein